MVTVGDCLKNDKLEGLVLLAGHRGLTRSVRLAHVVDEPDILSWVAPEIMVLTTAHNHPPDGKFWDGLVQGLAGHGVSALGVALGRYLPSLPDEALAKANELDFPVISIPWDIPFVQITQAIHRRIVLDHADSWSRVAELQVQVAEAAAHSKDLDTLVHALSNLVGREVVVSQEPPSIDGFTRIALPSPELSGWQLWCGPPKLAEPDIVMIRQAAVLAVWLLQQKMATRAELDSQAALLDQLLVGPWKDSGAARDRLLIAGVNPSQRFRLLLVTFPDHPAHKFQTHSFEDVWQTVKQHVGDRLLLMTFGLHGLICLLSTARVADDNLPRVLAPLFDRFPHCVAIISEPTPISDLPAAQKTLSRIAPLLPPGSVHDVSKAIFPIIISSLPDDLMRAFAAATWQRLDDAVLEQTLRDLIAVGGRRSEAAKLLGVHRNTITNRIEQIESLLGRTLAPEFLSQLNVADQWMRLKEDLKF